MVGETKISELGLLSSLNGTELIPAIQDQSGTWVNGSLTISNLGQMTEAGMNAIASPAVGLEVFNTTRNSKMFYHSFFGWTPVSINENPWWGYSFFNELTNVSGVPWTVSFSNGGTTVSNALTALSAIILYGLSTGTTTNGEARITTTNYFIGSVGKKRAESKVSVDTLSTSMNRYVCSVGYHATVVINQANAMYFLYDEGGLSTGSTASPNWQCVCASGGTRTFVTTSVPVTDISSGAMQKLRIDDDGTGANVKFYINEVLVATITTNVPTSAVTLANTVRIVKNAGTTQRVLYVDYMTMAEKFNSPR